LGDKKCDARGKINQILIIMKNFFFVAMAAALSLTSCRQDDSVAGSDSSFDIKSTSADYAVGCNLPVQNVSGNITSANNHWTADRIWEIDGIVNVQNGVTLTIDAGTYIKAKPNTNNTPTGVLVVQNGGKLYANGTSTAPVVFTSYNLLDCDDESVAAPGDFGGVVILGDAPINSSSGTATIEGLSGAQYQYGGSNASHDGGSLTYVRIEYAGFDLLAPNSGNEINGLTLGGVGNLTELENIQVSYGKDDAFEFFGGTVNASNIIAFAQDDDGFDFDSGYTGTITNALALADINSTHSTSGGVSDTNGIELDNNATGTSTTLITHPVINGLTIVGVSSSTTLYENGIHVRRSGQLTANDAVVVGYPRGIYVEGTGSLFTSSNFNSVFAHGFTTSASGPDTTLIPASNKLTGAISLPVFGMPQPFFNGGTVNLGSRNGSFFSSWTRYSGF
jgi:hypothetical protein